MNNKRMRRFLCWLVVFGLIFTSGIFSFADENNIVDNQQTAVEEVTPDLTPADDGATPELLQSDDPSPLEPEPAITEDVDETAGDSELQPIEPALEEIAPVAAELPAGVTPLVIKSVEVLNGGAVQILYRNEIYKGIAENGEDPDKYYTTRREFNLKDPRIFNVEFTVPASAVADPAAFLASVNFTYGGYDLSAWGNGVNWRGTTAVLILTGKSIDLDGDKYVVSAGIRCNSPWGAATYSATGNGNVPYSGYNGGTQSDFATSGTVQTGDNRAFFQTGPAYKGPGIYELAATSDGQPVAAVDMHIGPYDTYHSWIEINEFAQSLVEAINGEQISIDELNEKPIGLMAAGYVTKDADGNYAAGNPATDVYVEVSILGYGLTDNYMGANTTFNNYSRYNAIWNVAVAKDKNTIYDYLKPGGVKDQMNNDPAALIAKYENAAPEDIDLVLPFYQNNVHSDEVSGTDSMINLIDKTIEGGKAGTIIPYKTFQDDQITWNYRPSGNTNTGYTALTHVVQGGNYTSGAFAQTDSRTQMYLNTGEVLDKFILVNTLCSNPDGKAAMRRMNRYGMDLNRDTVFATQPETIALTQDIAKWDAVVMLEWHGYVTQMLIEPCTAPHCMNYEPDLTLNSMIQLAHYGGKALTASTGFNRFLVVWDHMAYAWDDGGNVYGPMFAMLFGTMGWTIELPFSNIDAFEAGNAITYAMLNELMAGETAYYDGNVLNGSIDGRDAHDVDIKYASLRKETVMNKLEFKLRGIENIDSMAADKYFIEVVDGVARMMGRIRHDNPNNPGEKLSYFPDYIIVPGDSNNQYNPAEAVRTLDFVMNYGAKVSRTTAAVTYNGVTYPEGTYVLDMKQGRRNFLYEIMGKGYDATSFASMYADIYCNFPDNRGFNVVEAWNAVAGADMFAGKIQTVASVEKQLDITGAPDKYVVFSSVSVDSVRFVNLLLSGRSSGPSYSEKGDVWMLRKSVEGIGTASDYIIKASDLGKVGNLVDNPDLGLKGCQLEGKYISSLPKEAVQLVEPIITTNTTRNIATTGGPMWWALDDYLGFNMKNADGSDYNGSSATTVRDGANVAFIYNGTVGGTLLSTIKSNKMGLVMVQSAASLTNANFGTSNTAAPAPPPDPTDPTGRRTLAFNDIAVYGTFNDGSLFTAKYADAKGIYARGNYFTENLLAESKELFRSLPENAFMGGFQATSGDKTVFNDKLTMFSTILNGGGITGKPIQSLSVGANVFFRPHYQIYYPILATGIFAGAAGILDDQSDPVIESVSFADGGVAISASDPLATDSGLADEAYALYAWNASVKDYDFVDKNASGEFILVNGNRYKAVVTDWAGNEAVTKFAYLSGKAFSYDAETASVTDTGVNATLVAKKNGNKNDLTIKVTENFYLDGVNVNTRIVEKTFSIDNNAAGTYDVEGYKVYVDTKGNTQIRELKIIDYVAQ